MEECYRTVADFYRFANGDLEWTIEKFYTGDSYHDVIVLEKMNGGYYDNYGIKDLHLGLRRIRSFLTMLRNRYPQFGPIRVMLNKGHYVLYRG